MPSYDPLVAALYQRATGVVARQCGIDPQRVRAPGGRAARSARQLAAYIVHVQGGAPICAVARAAGVRHHAVQKALAAVEERRDGDPGFDHLIDALSQEIVPCI